jgi:hypothetical protein
MMAENGSGIDVGNEGIMQLNGGGNNDFAGIVEQIQREAQIGLEMANDAQQRLQQQIGSEFGAQNGLNGIGGQNGFDNDGMSSNQIEIIVNSQCVDQSQKSPPIFLANLPQNVQISIQNEQQNVEENVFGIFANNPQQNLVETMEGSAGNEYREIDGQQLIEKRPKKKKSLPSSPTAAGEFKTSNFTK